ncbi:ROK family protein [Listeria booriae]|uniref:ROK family protein n=1 Tax=Listeria booriae TaxID=1552123 RepID=UPI00289342E5|nr:ROK family protein [Listeria booriae]
MKNLAAFDIGGTTLKMGLVSSEGTIIQHEKMTIPDFDGELILAGISDYTKKHDVAGIAISAPGYINPKTGFITMGGAIRAFDNFPLREYLEEKTGLPVTVENDANCVALCEKWVGGAQHLDNFLCMTVGTGIGGGIFIDGKLYSGSKFRAGEFGYLFSDRPGSFEPGSYTMNQTTTMLVLRRQYAAHTGKALQEVTGEEIFAAYDNHDPIAEKLIHDFYTGLCSGLYNLIYCFDPSHIFIGGGITDRPTFLDELKHHMAFFGLRDTELELVSHKNQAGLLGAAYHHLLLTKI